jgi:hypothetical protein
MKNYLSLEFGPLRGFGTLGLEGQTEASGAIGIFTKFLSSTIGLITIIAIIWFVFIFFTGAISWITAGGDKAALESARKKITSGLIGLVVTVAAIFIIQLVGTLIGIPNILRLPELFNQIQ